MSQNGKGSRNRVSNFKQFSERFNDIEWRIYGTYCEHCSANLRFPLNRKKHYDEETKSWCCNPRGDCNFN